VCANYQQLNLWRESQWSNKCLNWTGKSCPLDVCFDNSVASYDGYVWAALNEWNDA